MSSYLTVPVSNGFPRSDTLLSLAVSTLYPSVLSTMRYRSQSGYSFGEFRAPPHSPPLIGFLMERPEDYCSRFHSLAIFVPYASESISYSILVFPLGIPFGTVEMT
ncbi:hypothetical protein DTO282F9_1329 [Paecilomyces variotii]|nr:hypothetical protein DTO282F9_1329 [Paecilomyces variotii]